jgi:serine protease Do
VLGVVTAKLNAQIIAQRTGDVVQNIGFVLKADEATTFLRRIGIATPGNAPGAPRGAADIGDIANRSTVLIRCER